MFAAWTTQLRAALVDLGGMTAREVFKRRPDRPTVEAAVQALEQTGALPPAADLYLCAALILQVIRPAAALCGPLVANKLYSTAACGKPTSNSDLQLRSACYIRGCSCKLRQRWCACSSTESFLAGSCTACRVRWCPGARALMTQWRRSGR